jgi:hypothetical protein
MARSPALTSCWDARRQETSYKIAIEGTNKFLLFTDGTLRQLQAQINKALKGADDDQTATG